MRAILLLATVAVLSGGVAARAADSQFDPLMAGIANAWNSGDGPAFGAQFAPDADSIGTAGFSEHSSKVIADRHAIVFAGPLKGSKMAMKLTNTRMLGADYAVIDTLQTVQRPGKGTIQVFASMVVHRVDGQWLIVHGQNTPVDMSKALLPPSTK